MKLHLPTILVAISLLACALACASTPIPAIITEDTVLELAASPYLAEGQVLVVDGVTLTIEAGVQVRFLAPGELLIQGRLDCAGSAEMPITLEPEAGGDHWRNVYLFHANNYCELRHVAIRGALGGPLDWQKAAISSVGSDIIAEHVTFSECRGGIYANDADVQILDCVFNAGSFGEPVNIVHGSLLMERCIFYSGGSGFDSIDLDEVSSVVMRQCTILDSPDEGIDMSGSIALIEDCFIDNSWENGITAGEASILISISNIITNCPAGIVVSENSSGYIDHCDLHGNDYGVRVIERTGGWGGAEAEISNSIFSQSITADVEIGPLSSATLSFDISDNELHVGEGNLLDDPLFSDPLAGDFTLLPGSPCIDAGDPDAPLDPDSTRTDMGAIFRHSGTHAPENAWPSDHLSIIADPNPFQDGTRLSLYLPGPAPAELLIYSVSGRLLWRRDFAPSSAVWRSGEWEGRDANGEPLPAGVYLASLRQGERRAVAKLMILK